MGHFRKRSFCGVTKTVSPTYIAFEEGIGNYYHKWGHVVDNGEIEAFHNKGDDANIDDLKDKIYNVREINCFKTVFFKILN